MVYRIDDRWLWLGAGIALYITFKGISYAIRDIVRLTAIEPLDKDHDDERQQQPEDSISLDALRALATSPHQNISKSATDLLVARCILAEGLLDSVRADIKSSDADVRRAARTTNSFLRSWADGAGIDWRSRRPGARGGDGFADADLSPSVLSIESADEFEDSAGAGEALVPSEDDPVAGWAAVPRERAGSGDGEMRRRRREAMVLYGGLGSPGEEDIIRPRMR
ncbi:hypothetical protein WHR41_05762 [Cladosporium halotolerans]|uniref:Uncharacterized protein n=1 Tax=Cladosporium halotolerans TaxID=1052096 RepID=A0AB34KMM9_9PEZI